MMQKFWNWLLKSSADPTQPALTAKALVTSLVPILMMFVHNPNLNTLPDDIYSLIIVVFGLPASVMFAFGLSRKIFISLSG